MLGLSFIWEPPKLLASHTKKAFSLTLHNCRWAFAKLTDSVNLISNAWDHRRGGALLVAAFRFALGDMSGHATSSWLPSISGSDLFLPLSFMGRAPHWACVAGCAKQHCSLAENHSTISLVGSRHRTIHKTG